MKKEICNWKECENNIICDGKNYCSLETIENINDCLCALETVKDMREMGYDI